MLRMMVTLSHVARKWEGKAKTIMEEETLCIVHMCAEQCFVPFVHLAGVMSPSGATYALSLLGMVDHGQASRRNDMPLVRQVQAVRAGWVAHQWPPCLSASSAKLILFIWVSGG